MYYTLLIRDHLKAPWRIEFGSSDHEDVKAEREAYNDDGVKSEDMKVITTSGNQEDIDKRVALLNQTPAGGM